jgi:glycosyltransferase involved in cell wall biosynthesis
VSCVGAGPSVVIDEQTGFVVDNATVSWSNAIERLLDNPGLVVEMGKQGREFVKAKYSVTAQENTFLSLFTESQ